MAAKTKKSEKNRSILMISSEMVPFAKTGGLADVVGSLPIELAKLGMDVRVVIPRYYSIDPAKWDLSPTLSSMGVWMGGELEWCSVYQTRIRDMVTVYFIEHHGFFGRDGLYHDAFMNDFLDNPRRFAFLTRAALQLAIDLEFQPDVVHAHDWQTALAPAYLKTWFGNHPILGNAASVLTIHNAAYQGVYPKHHFPYIGLDWKHFHADAFESYDYINFLKGGIYFADLVNTVSPGYAREITSPHGGFRLAPYLSNKGENFFGILNGVDYADWSPENDKMIPQSFSTSDPEGKRVCKRQLQKHFCLDEDPKIPIFAAIGRFVDQKGFNLLAPAIERALDTMLMQFVILGSGDPGLQEFFGRLPGKYPGRAGSHIGYDIALSHLIEAGADFFLMPSLYEPCGLNQLYSLRYGTLPIVRATGGLGDTVENYAEATGEGTGFTFNNADASALYSTIGWANSTWWDRPAHIKKMRERAMRQDFSWDKSSAQYQETYEKIIAAKRKRDG
ncbi:MAG: glycogen synthase GlgA [Spirochaetota bacterium]|jgi:starch synthase|nr:glycogen synthase GlgA [Spirochaetota bacterium]